jgi:hypothetical protein
MTDTPESRRIVAGPSREELFDALRLRHEGRRVTFTLAPSHITGRTLAEGRKFVPGNMVFSVQVNELGIEDGSGNRWLFRLYDRYGVLGSCELQGYMDTTRRGGWLKPAEPRK